MSNELRYFNALKRITQYLKPKDLHKLAPKLYGGIKGPEAIEMAYENVLEEARQAIRGRRAPKEKK